MKIFKPFPFEAGQLLVVKCQRRFFKHLFIAKVVCVREYTVDLECKDEVETHLKSDFGLFGPYTVVEEAYP